LSNIGTWMHDVGAGWLMTGMSPSPIWVALVQTATTLPVFLLALPAGAHDSKTRELISMAVAITTRCDGCISSHAAAAAKAGATEAEMSDALGVAIALNAGAAYVYSLRAMEAFSEFKSA
jgi:AhpD family alkylhydroperoxidase